ncbi:N-acetyltransferase [Longispora fulva]|uniref:Ribosomal protein S18 acetylase RimI-like enzyme n=1 Tax=Longispora fulva TaxID=619741 RepID=A0A8J7GJJ3_9ACTN|nr:GNAT family N-acetyltransferase [Longispora fulva]MBG6138715.1 ribosomal protein S18 acetylase RimI-like enzyme [Longispora fulva]GIG58208.1 N-acetyltransferase [Longispora fulva]
MRVRLAGPADMTAIGAITVAAYVHGGQVSGDGSGYELALADAAGRAAGADLLVAVDDDDTVLGAVTFCVHGQRYAELTRPGEAEFRMLAVDRAAQGRGVGEALVRACLDRAVGLGCTAMVLCTRDESVALPARRLYTKMGFVRTPELDWSPVTGVTLDAWRLELAGLAR